MRMLVVIGLLLVAPCAGFAAPAAKTPPPKAAPSAQDKLFAELAAAESPEAAKPIEDKLGDAFKISGSASIDLLMGRINAALGGSDHGAARRLAEAVTRLAPDYAEGWRMRAMLQAASDDNAGAMISLQKSVVANPRHFLAISELAQMLEDYGDKPGALKLYRRALELDPQMQSATERVRALSREVEGQGI